MEKLTMQGCNNANWIRIQTLSTAVNCANTSPFRVYQLLATVSINSQASIGLLWPGLYRARTPGYAWLSCVPTTNAVGPVYK